MQLFVLSLNDMIFILNHFVIKKSIYIWLDIVNRLLQINWLQQLSCMQWNNVMKKIGNCEKLIQLLDTCFDVT